MNKNVFIAFTLASSLGIAGCAGREAHPVAMIQPQDPTENCDSIKEELAANSVQINKLKGEAATHNATNAAVGVVGAVLFWPALFALDLTDYEREEAAALQARDMHLLNMSKEHNCTT
ncbi:MAG TPA: hypothetical protein VGN34_00405, partial [Ktedonobacteraceae bacterium]